MLGIIKTKKFGVFQSTSQSKSDPNENKVLHGDDNCQSLFYGRDVESLPNGSGFPCDSIINSEVVQQMTTIHPDYRRLPMDFYKQAVENMIVVCVDVICQRKSDNKLLLFFRRDKPAANIWWWPGGRMFRGETFYQTAVRKISDESGFNSSFIHPQGIVHVWNTFFPDSSWDIDRLPGREGTQTVNIVVMCTLDDLDEDRVDQHQQQAAAKTWAIEARRWCSASEIIAQSNEYDKYVTLNVQKAIELRYL